MTQARMVEGSDLQGGICRIFERRAASRCFQNGLTEALSYQLDDMSMERMGLLNNIGSIWEKLTGCSYLVCAC